MRPPHYTGEDDEAAAITDRNLVASMRPPHYTGEDVTCPRSSTSNPTRFNEAPALHGGRH